MDNQAKEKDRTRRRNTANSLSLSSLEHGKLHQQAIDLEEAVLGSMLLEKDAVNTVIDILQGKSFYKESHQKIIDVIKDLFGKS